MKTKKLIICTKSYEYLGEAIQDLLGREEYDYSHNKHIKTETFPDGEIYDKLETNVEGMDVIVIAGTVNETDTLEIYHIGSGLANQGAKSITFVIPYFGYSTMERAVKEGEIVKAKNVARLLSSIPHGSGRSNRFMMVDLHSADVQHYFEGSAQTKHIYAKQLVMDLCHDIASEVLGDSYLLSMTDPLREPLKEIQKSKPFVLGSTDAGRAKWVESLAKDMGVDCAIIIKRRNSGSDTEVTGMNADVNGKIVIIYDDMIRTGGSIIKAAKAYKDAGASKVFAIATHGILPDDSIEKMQQRGYLEKVYVTDTHPNAVKLRKIDSLKSFFQVVSIDRILANAISGINHTDKKIMA